MEKKIRIYHNGKVSDENVMSVIPNVMFLKNGTEDWRNVKNHFMYTALSDLETYLIDYYSKKDKDSVDTSSSKFKKFVKVSCKALKKGRKYGDVLLSQECIDDIIKRLKAENINYTDFASILGILYSMYYEILIGIMAEKNVVLFDMEATRQINVEQ